MMMMRRRCIYVLLLLLLQYYNLAAASTSDNITTITTTTTTQLSRDHIQQKLALFEFKLSFSINTSSQNCDIYFFNGSSSWHPMNWSMDSDYCKWEGVTCNQRTGDVIGLELFCSHLVGSIHPNSTLFQLSHLQVISIYDNDISGVIPEEIFHLPNLKELGISPFYDYVNVSVNLPKIKWGSSNTLQELHLMDINIIGGVLPDSIGYLNSLTSLSLMDCNLSGFIPKSMSNLTQLTNLDLSYHQLSGQISNSLANLKKLNTLHLSGNNLNGEFPSWVVNLTQLQSLQLDDNSLTGTIPSWLFQLPSLTYLSIDSNKFTGQLPYQFNSSSSSYLQYFTCSNNSLYGTIPKSFSDHLVNLTEIDLSSNKFSGDLDLQTFSHLHYLDTLRLSHNSLSLKITSTTTLPPSLRELSLSSCKLTKFPHFIRSLESLGHLDLSNNQIDGNIPNWISGLKGTSSMYYLNLSHNSLTGGLEQLTWSSLQYLDLRSNMLNGSLSSSICNSTSLDILNLSHNNFSGVFPVCPGNLTYRLSVLDLRMNNITGSLPLALSKFQYLRTLNMHGNKLQGPIPVSFSKFDFLEVLDLGRNHINDTFPHCLEVLPNLQVLILKSNKFHGIINNISETEHPFPSLRIIDLSDNQFSGPLPAKYIDSFKGMMNKEVNKVPLGYMGDIYYSDSIALVIKGSDRELFKILTVFTTIDLSKNMFEGEIPAHIGNLVSLRGLNLSHNHLTGSIPSNIGDLSVLESLDFSSNQLVGEIPQQLTHIDSLAKLNLSQNDLNGRIPEAPHFNTFDNNSYSGNPGLCGFPLSKKCRVDNTESHEEDDDYFFNGFSWEAVVIGYGFGVVMGFVGGYIMFMAGKPKWYVGIIARELGLKVKRIEIVRR